MLLLRGTFVILVPDYYCLCNRKFAMLLRVLFTAFPFMQIDMG